MITYPYEHFFTDGVSVQTDIVITDGTASYSGTSLVVTGNTVLFTNENIHQEQMSLLETLCSENTLHFGSCEACEFKFTISSDVLPLEGKTLNVYLYFDHDASTLFQIGVYKVASDVGTAQRSIREITCYDALYDVLNADYTDWYNAINYTTINTVKKFRDAFFTHIGITQESVSLVNDSATIVENRAQAISGVQILRAICEINGRFGHIGRTGQFEYIKLEQNIQGLYPAIDLYPSPTLFPRQPKSTPIGRSGEYIPPLKYEEYEVPSITRLQLKTTEDDVGVTVGVAGTDYVIQGNFLTFGSTSLSTIATNILGEISGVVFQPFEVQMNADLCLEVGDAIRCNDDLTGVEGYVLYRQCVGIQAMRDTFNCHSERSYEQNVNNVSFQFQELNNRTLVIKQDVDGILWNLNDQNTGSYAWQTAEKIGAKVDETHGNQTTGFSWELTSSGHTWYKDTTEVMKIDGTGLSVKGSITSGSTITGATITGSSVTSTNSNTGAIATLDDGRLTCELTSGGHTRKSTFTHTFWTYYVDTTAVGSVAIPNDDVMAITVGDDNELRLFGGDIYIGTPDNYTAGHDASINIDGVHIDMGTSTNKSGNIINIGHAHLQGSYTGSFVEIKGYRIMLTANSILVNGNSLFDPINWGSGSGIENTGSGLALNPPNYSGYVHIGYQANAITIGSSSLNSVRIMGKDCSFHTVTIGNTTYHLLGYTS